MTNKNVLAAVFIIATVIRGGMLFLMPAGLNVDTDGYRRIAITLRETGVFGVPEERETRARVSEHSPRARATAYRPPLYPLVLAALVSGGKLSPWAVGSLHLVLGLATIFIVFRLGISWGLGNWSALAAILTACDPILLHQSTQIMTETLATFLAVLALAGLSRIWMETQRGPPIVDITLRVMTFVTRSVTTTLRRLDGLAVGAVIGLACLCRPTFLPWWGLVVASSICFKYRLRTRATVALSLTLGAALVLVSWGVRNYSQFGHFRISTTHGGYTLLLGNNPDFYRYLRSSHTGSVWDSRELDRDLKATSYIQESSGDTAAAHPEFDQDEFAYRLARRFIREDQSMFVRACLTRIIWLWQILPQRLERNEPTEIAVLRFASATWYAGLYGLVVAAILFRRGQICRAPWIWGVLMCLSFTAVHAIYWSNMRMRAPLMPFVCLVAASGAVEIARFVRSRNPRIA